LPMYCNVNVRVKTATRKRPHPRSTFNSCRHHSPIDNRRIVIVIASRKQQSRLYHKPKKPKPSSEHGIHSLGDCQNIVGRGKTSECTFSICRGRINSCRPAVAERAGMAALQGMCFVTYCWLWDQLLGTPSLLNRAVCLCFFTPHTDPPIQ
jgi:hypothetical protein